MTLRRAHISQQDQSLFWVTSVFLKGRLEERETINWALRLDPNDFVKRQALLDLINGVDGRHIIEPWKSAWRLIEEFWANQPVNDHLSVEEYEIKNRIDSGDRSGSLINTIADFVAPKLKVEKVSDIHLTYRPLIKRVRTIEDLFYVSLTSGKFLEPHQLGIEKLTNQSFLLSLALALDAVVRNGLDIARRLGWDEKRFWRLGQLRRVYVVPSIDLIGGEHEPDEFNDGIAPSTKLLHNVVSRLAEVDLSVAMQMVERWKSSNSPVYLRLWAAMSRDLRFTPSNDLADTLLALENECFWDTGNYPEISEVRAKRFISFSTDDQKALIKRIRKGPPRSFWSKKARPEQVKDYRDYAVVSEILRIHNAGGKLSEADASWLTGALLKFPEFANITSVDADFIKAPRAEWIAPNPDNQFDILSGENRLVALEIALSSARRNWNDRSPDRAADWIRDKLNSLLILNDFKTLADGGSMYPNVWEHFGWSHFPTSNNPQQDALVSRDLIDEATDVEALLLKLHIETIKQSIDGISHWISTWGKFIKDDSRTTLLWKKMWPIAVEATNSMQRLDEEPNLNIVAKSNNSEPMDLDTLNTPVGKLIDLFLISCPRIPEDILQFKAGSDLRKIADQIVLESGRSALIGKHRLIEQINYFIDLDADWTRKNLIAPLLEVDIRSVPLWRAIARRTQFLNVLEIIGDEVVKRVSDSRLGRATRQSLLFSLVLECLNSLYDQRKPAISYSSIQQMIRSLDDEIRVHGMQTLQRYVTQQNTKSSDTPEKRFCQAVVPFLKEIWPQERSLATPGISRALASLPAASGGVFVKAVDAIERFLVPFQCWSMIDYGLYGQINGEPKIKIINNQTKANTLLKLLNLTIGTSETSVIPYDLPSVLEYIRQISPEITQNYIYKRLSTAARRS